MKIIPAIDIIDGKCVRLKKGDYSQKKIYSDNPLEIAKFFEELGISHIHVVDLDGARLKAIQSHKILEKIALNTNLKIDFGGGINSLKDAEIAFESGASQITCGSMAVDDQMKFLRLIELYGSEKIILGADQKNGKIVIDAWRKKSSYNIIDFIKHYEKYNIKYVICTDTSRDGMLNGPSIKLYKEIIKQTNISLIASGGVRNVNDISKLKKIRCFGAIIGKAIYENDIDLKELC